LSFLYVYTQKGEKKEPQKCFFFKNRTFIPHFTYICSVLWPFNMILTPSIIADFKAGRLDSFYTEAYADLLTYAARLLGDHHALLAEDIVQDAIFKSYQQRNIITNGQQWKTYLFRIVHNAVVSIHRNHAAEQRYLSQQHNMEEDFTRTFIQQETFERLFAAIDALPERYQQIFQLSFEEGLRNNEIAERLQVSTRTIVKNKSRLVELVRQRLDKESKDGCMNSSITVIMLLQTALSIP